jgi:hypothetical protein
MLLPIAVYASIMALLVGTAMFFPLYDNAVRDPNPVVRALLTEQIMTLNARFWPMFFLSAVLTSIYVLVRSNRFAGPLYKLKVVLLQLTEGKYHPLRFRKADALHEFEEVTNRLANRMEALSTGNVKKMAAIESRLQSLKTRLEAQGLPSNEIAMELGILLAQVGSGQSHRSGSR